MIRTPFLFGLFALLTVSSLAATDRNQDSIFGTYKLDDPGGLSSIGITLKPDSTYIYFKAACLFSQVDSGTYTYNKGIIRLNSKFSDIQQADKFGRGQRISLNGREFLIVMSKLYYQKESENFDLRYYWIKGLEPAYSLFNKKKQIVKMGTFKNNKLYTGTHYYYDSNDSLQRIQFLQEGIVIKDSLLIK